MNVLASIGGMALQYLGQNHANQMQQDQANTNTKKDYDFAQNQIQWRVKDAQKAGIHPLAALGANPITPSATTIGTENPYAGIPEGLKAVSSSIANKRLNELQLESLQEDVKGKKLQNERIAAELATTKQAGAPTLGTSFMPGGSQSVKDTRIQEKPLQRTTSHKDKNFMEPGALTGAGFEATPTGLAPVPSGDIKERLEDSPYELRHFWKYGVLPNLGATATKPPLDALPKGFDDWEWSVSHQEWQPTKGEGKSPLGQYYRWFKKRW